MWAVNLAIYQQVMEPSGFHVFDDGTQTLRLAENFTYWPREMRQLGIRLAWPGWC